MGAKLGMKGCLYYKPGGVAGPGVWTLLGNVKDVTLGLEKGEADVSTRANSGWRATVATLKEGSVEWEMVWDPDDAGMQAIFDAWLDDTVIGLTILDGPIATPGSQGLRADFAITKFGREEPLEEGMKCPVTAKITFSATPPEWHVVPTP